MRPRKICAALHAIGLATLASCAEPATPNGSAKEMIDCKARGGSLPREDCTAVAEDFGALSLSGAIKIAREGRAPELRVDAIHAAAGLANRLKDERLALCEAYNRCEVEPNVLASRDKDLGEAMKALLELWGRRNFGDARAVQKFREAIADIDRKSGSASRGRPDGAPPVAGVERTIPAAEFFEAAPGTSASVRTDGSSVVATSQGGAAHDVLRPKAGALRLASGHRYAVRVVGTYAPASAGLFQAGDELAVRLKYRAKAAGELHIALRSLEDPDAAETTASTKTNGAGTFEAKFSAPPGSSGFYVGVRMPGVAVELDDVEVVRTGKVVAAARAEAPNEAHVSTKCPFSDSKPLAGKKSFTCSAVTGDALTLGLPDAYLLLTVRGKAGEMATLRTGSLEGGRTLDASGAEEASLFVGLAGAGKVTVRHVEIREIAASAHSPAARDRNSSPVHD